MARVNSVPCTGDENCPFCKMFGAPAKQKMMVNVVDRQDGQLKSMVVDKERYDELFGKVMPTGRRIRVRLGKFEVIFWFMWWRLAWNDRRSGMGAGFRFWMFGPWEFREY